MTLLQCKRCGTRELAEKPRIFHRTQRECLAALGERVLELEQLTKRLIPPEPSVTQELPIPAVASAGAANGDTK